MPPLLRTMKPPKNMQLESVRLDEKAKTRGFGGDSFRNYMTTKIENQRRQFGVQLPPPPSPPSSNNNKRVRFVENFQNGVQTMFEQPTLMGALIGKLHKRHGKWGRRRRDITTTEPPEQQHPPTEEDPIAKDQEEPLITAAKYIHDSRPDLFFQGVCVMVNGYTNPDNETLQRMLHRHGGDLEKYETMRITHIIAESLSMAKVKIYRKQRKPIPVCRPEWIVASVKAGKLLPHADYLLELVRDPTVVGVKQFLQPTKSASEKHCGQSSILRQPKYSVSLKRKRSDNHENNADWSKHNSDESESSIPSEPTHPEDDDLTIQSESSGHERVLPTMDELQNNAVGLHAEPLDQIEKDADYLSDDHHELEHITKKFVEDDPPVSHEVYNTTALDEMKANTQGPSTKSLSNNKTDSKYINGRLRTTGTDPNFLESFFSNSRLSFIGSFQQRTRTSPTKMMSEDRDSTTRLVLHVDMDSFFASVVLRNYPEYKDKPVAISHNGTKEGMDCSEATSNFMSTSECATCNYVARTFGIQKGMFLGRARELCPDLIVLPYDFEGYEEVSEQVADILYQQAQPFFGTVEQVSCDESYMELHVSKYGDASVLDMAKDIAENIRERILSTTRCTATVGVASNKLLAKLATDKAKPNGSHVVRNYHELLEPLQLRDLHGIGSRLNRKLATEGLVSVRDIWDLGDHAAGELCRILGPGVGMKILGFCRGEDDRPVKAVERKTIGAECNYGVRFDGDYGVDYMIQGLAKEIQKRMEAVSVRGSRVTLKLKQRKANAGAPPKFLGHGSCHSLSRSMDTPGGTPNNDWQEIFRIGMILFDELAVPKEDIRGMGITISKLASDKAKEVVNVTTRSISSFFKDTSSDPLDSHNDEVTPPFALKGSSCIEERDHLSGILALPPSRQIDNEVLASLPEDIRAEIEAATEKRSSEAERRNVLELEKISPYLTDDDDDDVMYLVVPPASQVHMSQVQQMPSPIRRQIMAKLQERRAEIQRSDDKLSHHHHHDAPAPLASSTESGYQQVSVKRLFQLAAVKTGTKTLSSQVGGDAVSMTQLDRLPLAVQLQIANNDHQSLGTTPAAKRKLAPLVHPSERLQLKKPRKGIDKRGGRDGGKSSKNFGVSKRQQREPAEMMKDVQEEEATVAWSQLSSMTMIHPREFYLQNTLPLRTWMDENSPDITVDAIANVEAFLSVCVDEDRLSDVVKLLRSIKNRRDAWNGAPFTKIVAAVDNRILQSRGQRLDLEWLGLY